MPTDLISCPVCGADEASVVKNWGEDHRVFVCCQRCLVSTRSFNPHPDAVDKARKEWNQKKIIRQKCPDCDMGCEKCEYTGRLWIEYKLETPINH